MTPLDEFYRAYREFMYEQRRARQEEKTRMVGVAACVLLIATLLGWLLISAAITLVW